MSWRSTTFRFAALVFLLQFATAVLLLSTVAIVVRDQVEVDLARTADVLRDDLLTTYAQGGAPALATAVEIRTTRNITPGTVLFLADRSGRRIAGDLADWPPNIRPGARSLEVELYRRGHAAPEPMRVQATTLANGDRLLTGAVMTGSRRLLGLLEGAVLFALSLGLALATLAAWMAARMIVGRLSAPLETLEAVRRGALSRRVPADRSGDAFAALAAAVNGTLDRIEALVRELKLATDSLAHDLRSPLTRLDVALQRAAATVREPDATEAVTRALAEGERLRAIVETALSISRAEAGMGREHFVALDLAAELELIAELYGPLAEDRGREIRVVAPAPITLPVHRELLGRALGNLIDNALNYGAGDVVLTLSEEVGGPAITIADQGPGIPPDRRAAALRRFGRLDDARSGGGAGLGLSLVAAVAHLHSGELVLGDAAPGLTVTIRLKRDG